jgi:Uma2 family endonuclease
LLFLLGQHVYTRDLGWLFSQDTGFKIISNPDTVRAPDVAFASRKRQPQVQKRGYGALAPDLVAEILSLASGRSARSLSLRRALVAARIWPLLVPRPS